MSQPMTHSEVNIKYFVKNSPVFMNDEDRKRSLQKEFVNLQVLMQLDFKILEQKQLN